MNVDDIFRVLHHHWALDNSTFPDGRQVLQLAFLILICAYTATRPGALVYVKKNAKVVTKCALKIYNEDRDVEAGESNGEDSSEDDGEDDDEDEGEDDDKDDGKDEEFQDKMDVDPDELVETLCYKHVTLILLRKPEAERDLLAMEIDLRFTKGHKRKYKR